MARGDIVNGIASVANTAHLTYQPAAGVEVIITAVATGRRVGTTQDVVVELYNGANYAKVFDFLTAALAWPESQLRLGINNTRYLTIFNNTGGDLVCGYSGIQTKGSQLKLDGKILSDDELKALRHQWADEKAAALKANPKVPSDSVHIDLDDLGEVRGIQWVEKG